MEDLVSNRKAYHNYEILQTFEAGIVLLGTEIKSLRAHGGSLNDAYAAVKDNGELFLINASIAPYRFGNVHNHEDRRERKLLMHKKEILKLKKAVSEKGLAIIPVSFFLKNGFVKVKIALAKGKRLYDKRRALKDKEEKRSIQKNLNS
ncbi:MAG: SsrA-binding protein SmpB [Parachlamydiales bacterium]|jgi:SsrA-binding protein